MRIHLLAVGARMPQWVTEGYRHYSRRLPRECALQLTEIRAVRRAPATPVARAVQREGERLLAAVPAAARVIALDERGGALTTRELARGLGGWMREGRDVALLIGGADGLAPACLARAESRWSLSPLTLPHGLVRVIVAEQLYRAWSTLHNHPYHRE